MAHCKCGVVKGTNMPIHWYDPKSPTNRKKWVVRNDFEQVSIYLNGNFYLNKVIAQQLPKIKHLRLGYDEEFNELWFQRDFTGLLGVPVLYLNEDANIGGIFCSTNPYLHREFMVNSLGGRFHATIIDDAIAVHLNSPVVPTPAPE